MCIFSAQAFPGMGVPFKRPAADKSGIPVYQPGTTYQQLMQLQQPFVPVSCEYPCPSPTATTTSNPQSSTANPITINDNNNTFNNHNDNLATNNENNNNNNEQNNNETNNNNNNNDGVENNHVDKLVSAINSTPSVQGLMTNVVPATQPTVSIENKVGIDLVTAAQSIYANRTLSITPTSLQQQKLVTTSIQSTQQILNSTFVPQSHSQIHTMSTPQYQPYSAPTTPFVTSLSNPSTGIYNLTFSSAPTASQPGTLFNTTNGVALGAPLSASSVPNISDPALMARELAHKNYANALKLAAASNIYSGKPLTAFNYTGVALNMNNKTPLLPTHTSKAKTSHIATHFSTQLAANQAAVVARQMGQINQIGQMVSIAGAVNNATAPAVLSRPSAMLVPNVSNVTSHQFFRHPKPTSASSISTMPLNNMSLHSVPFLPFAGTHPIANIQAVAPHPFTSLGSLQALPQMPNAQQTATNAAVVLNPYKKMKTS